MRKGSLVMFVSDSKTLRLTGVVIKGPYGAVVKEQTEEFIRTWETSVVDVLFHSEVFEKVPVSKLKVIK